MPNVARKLLTLQWDMDNAMHMSLQLCLSLDASRARTCTHITQRTLHCAAALCNTRGIVSKSLRLYPLQGSRTSALLNVVRESRHKQAARPQKDFAVLEQEVTMSCMCTVIMA